MCLPSVHLMSVWMCGHWAVCCKSFCIYSCVCSLDELVMLKGTKYKQGCCRYYMMYGISPFERVLNEAGGSLALAVIK